MVAVRVGCGDSTKSNGSTVLSKKERGRFLVPKTVPRNICWAFAALFTTGWRGIISREEEEREFWVGRASIYLPLKSLFLGMAQRRRKNIEKSFFSSGFSSLCRMSLTILQEKSLATRMHAFLLCSSLHSNINCLGIPVYCNILGYFWARKIGAN